MAEPKDEKEIYDLLKRDVEENAVQVATLSPERILAHIRAAMFEKKGIIGVIRAPDGVMVGVTILLSVQWWWSNQYFFQEVVNYVHPDYRRSRYGDDLLEFQKWAVDVWSTQFGYRIYLVNGVLGAWRQVPKILMYQRKFQMMGAAFVYPPPVVKGK